MCSSDQCGTLGRLTHATNASPQIRHTSSSKSSTVAPVIAGQTGVEPILQGAADFDLELIESRTSDARSQELIYPDGGHSGPTASKRATA